MTVRLQIILLSLAIFSISFALSAVRSEGGVPGSFNPISNFNDELVMEAIMLAKEAVRKSTGQGLEFQNVVSGKYQLVNGINYKLVISVMDTDGPSCTYEVDVSYGPFSAPTFSVTGIHKIE